MLCSSASYGFSQCSSFFFKLFILLYNIALVLPYIYLNLPWVYMCSPSWNPLQLPPHPTPLGHPSAPAPSILYHSAAVLISTSCLRFWLRRKYFSGFHSWFSFTLRRGKQTGWNIQKKDFKYWFFSLHFHTLYFDSPKPVVTRFGLSYKSWLLVVAICHYCVKINGVEEQVFSFQVLLGLTTEWAESGY